MLPALLPTGVVLLQGRPGSSAGLRGELGEPDGGEGGLLPPGRFRSFTLPAQQQDRAFGRQGEFSQRLRVGIGLTRPQYSSCCLQLLSVLPGFYLEPLQRPRWLQV